MKKISSLLIFFLILACNADKQKDVVLQGEGFGTTYNIHFFSSQEFDAKKGIDSVINAVNNSVSTYIPQSDISKINRGDSTIVVDDIFSDVFNLSAEVNKKSNGYFDPTIGVLRNAYGFGDTKPLQKIDAKTLDSLMEFVGFQKVKLKDDGTISKERPQIYFDFNANAKGYGIDCIGRYLESKGVSDYLIELGGEILAKGRNQVKDKSWIVGIEAITLDLADRKFTAKAELLNVAMAASGNYRKTRIDSASGKRYVHTINPLTGSAEMSDVTSATVLAPTCAEADAYATTFMAMGLEKSKELLKNLPGIEAYLTYNDSANFEQKFVTEGFENLLVK